MSLVYKYKEAPVASFDITEGGGKQGVFSKELNVRFTDLGALLICIKHTGDIKNVDRDNLFLTRECAIELRDGLTKLIGDAK